MRGSVRSSPLNAGAHIERKGIRSVPGRISLSLEGPELILPNDQMIDAQRTWVARAIIGATAMVHRPMTSVRRFTDRSTRLSRDPDESPTLTIQLGLPSAKDHARPEVDA